jgi:site-specific DNA-adenine methylase
MPLPYHAGKAKLAPHISKIIFKKVKENPSIKNYAEPFSGMMRVGVKVMEDDKEKLFKKYMFTDVNPTISVLFKALKKGWLPKLENITQKKWESYKKNKKPSAQKSFVGYTLGFGGQYFGGKNVRTEKRSHGGKNFAANYMKSKKKYLKELQPYFKSSKFSYKEKSVFDLDFKDTIIYCDPPYVSTAFRAKKIWDKEKEKKLWNTIKEWLEPSKNNIVILSNSKRTNKMKGLRVKKIYEDNVEYGSWKPNYKKRKEMIFEVVNSSGRKTRKKRGGQEIIMYQSDWERQLTNNPDTLYNIRINYIDMAEGSHEFISKIEKTPIMVNDTNFGQIRNSYKAKRDLPLMSGESASWVNEYFHYEKEDRQTLPNLLAGPDTDREKWIEIYMDPSQPSFPLQWNQIKFKGGQEGGKKKRRKKTRKMRGGGVVECPKVGTENAGLDSLLPANSLMQYDFKAVRKGVVDFRQQPAIIIEAARMLTEEERSKCRRGYFVNRVGNTVRMADDDAAPFVNMWEVGQARENIWEIPAERRAKGLENKKGSGGGKRRRKTRKKRTIFKI